MTQYFSNMMIFNEKLKVMTSITSVSTYVTHLTSFFLSKMF